MGSDGSVPSCRASSTSVITGRVLLAVGEKEDTFLSVSRMKKAAPARSMRMNTPRPMRTKVLCSNFSMNNVLH